MPRPSYLLLILLALGSLAGSPAPARAQNLLGAGVGAVTGLATGGYITVAIVVARARFEDEYVLEIEDILDWESIPAIVSPAIGGTFGFVAPERMYRSVLTGTAGLVTGAGVGLVLGHFYWGTVDGRWAGAAIGAGAGVALGALAGLLWPGSAGGGDDDGPALRAPPAVPLALRIPL